MEGRSKTAVIYARVSSQSDRQSTDRQVSDLTTYATANNYNLTKVFTEKVSGAKTVAERPVLSECLEYCIDNKIDTLLIWELSRLGRNTLSVLQTLDTLHSNGISVYIRNIGLYSLDPDGTENPIVSMILTVLAEMAKIERGSITERLQSGRAAYIAKGGRLGRSVGSRKPKEQKKEEYKNVLAMLRKGVAIRLIAETCKVGASTVQRLKKEFEL